MSSEQTPIQEKISLLEENLVPEETPAPKGNPAPEETPASEKSPAPEKDTAPEETPVPEIAQPVDTKKREIKYPGVGNLGIMPKDVLLKIFSSLNESELRAVMPVSKGFESLANDNVIWKKIYRKHFRFDRPLLPAPAENRFVFVDPAQSGLANPWKESIKTFYHAYHVHKCFEEPEKGVQPLNPTATDHLSLRHSSSAYFDPQTNFNKRIVFLHKGTWNRLDILDLLYRYYGFQNGRFNEESPYGQVCIIGAASGPDVTKSVVVSEGIKCNFDFCGDIRISNVSLGPIYLSWRYHPMFGPELPTLRIDQCRLVWQRGEQPLAMRINIGRNETRAAANLARAIDLPSYADPYTLFTQCWMPTFLGSTPERFPPNLFVHRCSSCAGRRRQITDGGYMLRCMQFNTNLSQHRELFTQPGEHNAVLAPGPAPAPNNALLRYIPAMLRLDPTPPRHDHLGLGNDDQGSDLPGNNGRERSSSW